MITDEELAEIKARCIRAKHAYSRMSRVELPSYLPELLADLPRCVEEIERLRVAFQTFMDAVEREDLKKYLHPEYDQAEASLRSKEVNDDK